ncbi:MAG: ComEA family DNA-binding protein [Nitrospiraceae bacterium]
MSLARSLLIKLAMLTATVALVLWIGWPTQGPDLEPGETAPASSPQTSQTSTPGPLSAHEPAPPALAAPATKRVSRLDINRATIEELQHLPGIGEVLARRVIERRTAHGPFRTVDELREVTGIGDKRLERLRPLVVAGPPAVAAKGHEGL